MILTAVPKLETPDIQATHKLSTLANLFYAQVVKFTILLGFS